MAQTDVSLYRSVRKEQFPGGVIVDDNPVVGVLYPDFEPKKLPSGDIRAPDVEVFKDTNQNEWVKSGGGTSLFDKQNVFKGKSWLSFEIPEGTEIPDSLIVRNTGFNQRFQATHFQIESRMKTMRVDAFKGALDNLARNAVVRKLELA